MKRYCKLMELNCCEMLGKNQVCLMPQKDLGCENQVAKPPASASQPLNDLLHGKITISRVQSNVEDDYISVEINYDGKHLRGKMAMRDYANCISGLARQDILIKAV